MGKNDDIRELAKLLSFAVAHRIGQIINPDAIYAEKYQKESRNFVIQAEGINLGKHWNSYDKIIIKKEVRKKTLLELINKEHIADKKFEIMDEEINKILKELELD